MIPNWCTGALGVLGTVGLKSIAKPRLRRAPALPVRCLATGKDMENHREVYGKSPGRRCVTNVRRHVTVAQHELVFDPSYSMKVAFEQELSMRGLERH